MMGKIRREVVVHLSGGLRSDLLNKENFLLWPISKAGSLEISNVPEGEYINLLNSFGIRWIGIDEVVSFDGMIQRIWSTFTYGRIKFQHQDRGINETSDYWGAISVRLRKDGRNEEAELARKIAFEIVASEIRLRDISDCYGLMLQYACQKDIGSGNKFSNLEVHNLILACHSFLGEMCALRDYLASFIAKSVLNIGSLQYMTSLVKKIKADRIDHPLAEFIYNSFDKEHANPWLWYLSEYRNHITHVAPIHHLANSVMMMAQSLQNPYGVDVRRVTFEIPYNIKESQGHTEMCDALDRFHDILIFMEQLANRAAVESRISPEITLITGKDIISIDKLGISDR